MLGKCHGISLGQNCVPRLIDISDLSDCSFTGKFVADYSVNGPHCSGALVVGEGLDAGKGVPREVLKDWELEVGAVVGVVGGFGGVLLLVAKDSSSQVSGVKTGDDGLGPIAVFAWENVCCFQQLLTIRDGV